MRAESAYLAPASFIDSGTPRVAEWARGVVEGVEGEIARARALYFAVRDGIAYDPYLDFSAPDTYRASAVLSSGRGFCVGKAALLAACARAAGIPARVGYADVRNHMTSPRLRAFLQSEVFIWHSYADLFIEGRWAKATPAFNLDLCAKAGVVALDFDGRSDSLFQPYSADGRRHMEYLKDRGTFADVPFETIRADLYAFYPRMMGAERLEGSFALEVERNG